LGLEESEIKSPSGALSEADESPGGSSKGSSTPHTPSTHAGSTGGSSIGSSSDNASIGSGIQPRQLEFKETEIKSPYGALSEAGGFPGDSSKAYESPRGSSKGSSTPSPKDSPTKQLHDSPPHNSLIHPRSNESIDFQVNIDDPKIEDTAVTCDCSDFFGNVQWLFNYINGFAPYCTYFTDMFTTRENADKPTNPLPTLEDDPDLSILEVPKTPTDNPMPIRLELKNSITSKIDGKNDKKEIMDACRDFRRLGGCTHIKLQNDQIYTPSPSSNSMEFIKSFLEAYQTWDNDLSDAINKGLELLNNPVNLTEWGEDNDIKFLMGIANGNPLIARIMTACAQGTTGIWYTPMALIFIDRNFSMESVEKSYEISFQEASVVISQTHKSNLKNLENTEEVIDSFCVQFEITLNHSGDVTDTRASIKKPPKTDWYKLLLENFFNALSFQPL
jgi:hypothetical protein